MPVAQEDVWIPLPAAPGNNATATLYDSTADPGTGTTGRRVGYGARFRRILVSVRADQSTATNGYVYQESDDGGTNWITVNNSGTGETLTGGTDYSRDHLRTRKDFRITWTASATGPSVFRGGVTLVRGERSSGL